MRGRQPPRLPSREGSSGLASQSAPDSRFEGKNFQTVVQELAAEAGVAVSDAGGQAKAPIDDGTRVLGRACEAALAHWAERLSGDAGADARSYLKARGIEEATARQYRLGYAPPEWHDLEGALRGRGFAEADLIRAGLLCEGSNGRSVHDRFRGRVIFPFLKGAATSSGSGRGSSPQEGTGRNTRST